MGAMPIMISGVIQGLGIGLIFVPLSTLAFATLAPRHRPEATGVYTLMRSLGSSVGISVMQGLWTSNTQVVHSSLAAHIDPSDPVTRAALPPMMSFTNPSGLEALNGEITRQAAMVAYVDDFRVMMLITLGVMPLLLLMRTPRYASEAPHVAVD
jgi:DHA2 family multidrug resistance protein